MNDLEDVDLRDRCQICGKPIRFWHNSLAESDDLVSVKWHAACAANYKEWLYKVTHVLPSYSTGPDIPRNFRWDRYFASYQRKMSESLNDKK